MSQPLNVAILLFDDVEVLDFAGPFEVFSVTGRHSDPVPFNVYTVAEKHGPIIARNGLSINPHYTIDNCPPPQILVVPGGFGTRREMHNPVIVDWVKTTDQQTDMTLSVCTGALILAKAGLLDGRAATTHFGAFDLLREFMSGAEVLPDVRFVDNGRIITSAGISAGIDMSLHVVARLLGEEQARETAHYMEYHWRNDGGVER